MAGLGRVQQRFNAAVITLLTLAGLGRMSGKHAKEAARNGQGHPIHAKYLRTQNVDKATGRNLPDYQGYCSGLRYDQDGRKMKREPRIYVKKSQTVANTPWWSYLWAKAGFIVLALMMSAGVASAQTGNCGGPSVDTLVANPTKMVFQNVNHSIAQGYIIGVVDPAITPNPQAVGATFVSQTPVAAGIANPLTIAGETDCYELTLPLSVQATLLLLKQYRGALNYSADIGAGLQLAGWSTASNPFVKAGPLSPLGVVRVKK